MLKGSIIALKFNANMLYMVAITFNSIAMGVGRQLISSVVRQGGFSLKYSAHSLLYFGKSSFILVRYTVTSTILSQLLPLSSKMYFMLRKTLWHCASIS